MSFICPRTGQPCYKDKCVYLTEVSQEGQVKEMHLCQDCVIKKNESIEEVEVKADKVLEMLQILMSNSQPVYEEIEISQKTLQKKHACQKCGSTLEDIAKTSRMGCEGCYEQFSQELMPILIKNHKSLEHKGKRIKPKPKSLEEVEDLQTLEILLKQAIEYEKYEKAGELRDKIKKLKELN